VNAELLKQLSAPIPIDEIGWKPQAIKDGKALMVAYVDARWVAQRLDAATGGEWGFTASVIDSNLDRVVVKGTLNVDGWIREDVGEYRKQRDTDDMEMYKAAVSDAFKRAAVMFGVGRELYSLPISWVDWDVQRKRPAPGAMDKLDKMVARGREQKPVEPDNEPEDREVDLSPLKPLIEKLNTVYHLAYNVGQVVVSTCGVDIPEDLTTLNPRIGQWYKEEAIHAVAGQENVDGYDLDKVLAYITEKAPGKTIGDLKKQYDAIVEYFRG